MLSGLGRKGLSCALSLTSALVPSMSLFFFIYKKTVAAAPLGGMSMIILHKLQSPAWTSGQAKSRMDLKVLQSPTVPCV